MNYLKLEIFSAINIVIMFFVFKFLKKKDLNNKQVALVFMTFSLLTVFTHYIDIIVSLLNGHAYTLQNLPNIYFLPVYPCNIMMWLNVIMIPLMFKRGKFCQFLANFIFFIGSGCAFFGLILNENFLSNPNFLDLYSLKAIVSHVFLLYACISLKVFNVFKIQTIQSVLSGLFGIFIFLISNIYTNAILKKLNRETVDSLFTKGLNDQFKFINFYSIIVIALIILIVVTTIYETKVYPLKERWYYRLKERREENYD